MRFYSFISVIIFSLNMQASSNKEFDANALQLLTDVYNMCSDEFIESMKGANRVGNAVSLSPRPSGPNEPMKLTYRITTVGGGYGLSSESFDVATLIMERTEIIEKTHVPNRGVKWNTTCSVTNHQQ